MTRTVTFYGLKTCDTCRKAKKYLLEKGVTLEERAIRQEPPSREELERWIDPTSMKSFLNTSSEDYRAQGLGQRTLSKGEVLDLLEATPNLIKRPVVVAEGRAVFGFKPDQLDALLKE